jgi:hypothetical protein
MLLHNRGALRKTASRLVGMWSCTLCAWDRRQGQEAGGVMTLMATVRGLQLPAMTKAPRVGRHDTSPSDRQTGRTAALPRVRQRMQTVEVVPRHRCLPRAARPLRWNGADDRLSLACRGAIAHHEAATNQEGGASPHAYRQGPSRWGR